MNSKQRRKFNRKFKHYISYPHTVHTWRMNELKKWCRDNTGEFIVDDFINFRFSDEKDAVLFKLKFY